MAIKRRILYRRVSYILVTYKHAYHPVIYLCSSILPQQRQWKYRLYMFFFLVFRRSSFRRIPIVWSLTRNQLKDNKRIYPRFVSFSFQFPSYAADSMAMTMSLFFFFCFCSFWKKFSCSCCVRRTRLGDLEKYLEHSCFLKPSTLL